MKYQRLFSGQNKNIVSECRLLNVLPSVKFNNIAPDKALLFLTKSHDIFFLISIRIHMLWTLIRSASLRRF